MKIPYGSSSTLESIKARFNDSWICSMGGCFEWIGNRDPRGRGYIVVGKKLKKAHRVSWFLSTGEWPPDDILVCHHCDNPSCVRFDHLFLGTHKDNTQDSVRKGRRVYPCGENHGNAKLTTDQIILIREEVTRRGDAPRIAKMLSVSESTVKRIAKMEAWKHVSA